MYYNVYLCIIMFKSINKLHLQRRNMNFDRKELYLYIITFGKMISIYITAISLIFAIIELWNKGIHVILSRC